MPSQQVASWTLGESLSLQLEETLARLIARDAAGLRYCIPQSCKAALQKLDASLQRIQQSIKDTVIAETSPRTMVTDRTLRLLETGIGELHLRFENSTFAREVFRVPRTLPSKETPLSPPIQAIDTAGARDIKDQQQWMRKVNELTMQLQQSTSFWTSRVRHLNDVIEQQQRSVKDKFGASSARTKEVITALVRCMQSLLSVVALAQTSADKAAIREKMAIALEDVQTIKALLFTSFSRMSLSASSSPNTSLGHALQDTN